MLLGVLLPFESISEYDNKQRITIKYQIEKCQDSYFCARPHLCLCGLLFCNDHTRPPWQEG